MDEKQNRESRGRLYTRRKVHRLIPTQKRKRKLWKPHWNLFAAITFYVYKLRTQENTMAQEVIAFS